MSKKTANILRHQKDCHEDGGACSWAKYPHQEQGRDTHRGSQTPKTRALQRLSVQGVVSSWGCVL